MQIDIIVVSTEPANGKHNPGFVPSLTGIHLAALTPAEYTVRVTYQQVEPVNYDSNADLVALSFLGGFAGEAYKIAFKFKGKGKLVVAGGPHVTAWPDEALQYCDAVIVGEAESVWAEMLSDAKTGQLKKRYYGKSLPITSLPSPRYDLLPDSFFIKKVVQATRGCPFNCSFCSVPTLSPGFRMRDIEQVLKDINYSNFKHWWQRKVVWFWDDNLTANRAYAKRLLAEMIPLKKWWIAQASLDMAEDDELLALMGKSGCIGVFFGIESFSQDSLVEANKHHNQVERYKACIKSVHGQGIAVMAGLIAGFDADTKESLEKMPDQIQEIGVDVPLFSILTPYKGALLYDKLAQEKRLVADGGWELYNGSSVSFCPKNMSADELVTTYCNLWQTAFSPGYALRRVARAAFTLRPAAAILSVTMNSFYSLSCRLSGSN